MLQLTLPQVSPAQWDKEFSFLQLLAKEHGYQPAWAEERLREFRQEAAQKGSYRHSFRELQFGARVAWRNSARCIGRLAWRSLQVLDQRETSRPDLVYEALLEHLDRSTNEGKIVPTITIFAPQGPRIHNSQLLRYACDPEQQAFLSELQREGWQPSGERFQVLPLKISHPDHATLVREIPTEHILEVSLEHPEYEWFSKLQLRWHALPAMSDRVLEIGGLLYPCAPFSAWYMGTEIGARNLGDEHRYNLLPLVAQKMGLNTEQEWSLWRDRALVDLNRAVLHSFHRDRVTIIDHHKASRQFLRHLAAERAAGREVPADWSWIVPPVSGSATPVFHTPMQVQSASPNFFTREEAGLS